MSYSEEYTLIDSYLDELIKSVPNKGPAAANAFISLMKDIANDSQKRQVLNEFATKSSLNRESYINLVEGSLRLQEMQHTKMLAEATDRKKVEEAKAKQEAEAKVKALAKAPTKCGEAFRLTPNELKIVLEEEESKEEVEAESQKDEKDKKIIELEAKIVRLEAAVKALIGGNQ